MKLTKGKYMGWIPVNPQLMVLDHNITMEAFYILSFST